MVAGGVDAHISYIIVIIILVASGVFEHKQQINPGTQKAPPGIWQGSGSPPDPGPDEAASQQM
jgi:hypothetical protein